MTTSGKTIESINEKIAILRNEIAQAGKLGLLNINKHCENFVKGLLNRTYGYSLVNLNEHIMNVPGLDLGDTAIGVGFQVSSDSRSDKVNDTLSKVIRYNHYTTYKKIKLFILSNKQNTYNITVDTEPYFHFDPKLDILDFNDFLHFIQNLELPILKNVQEFVESELPYTVGLLKETVTEKASRGTALINIEDSLSTTGHRNYEHFSAVITLRGSNFSTPIIYSKLMELSQNQQFFKHSLFIFNIAFRQQNSMNSQQMEYRQQITPKPHASNTNSEAVLIINNNKIRYEFANYNDDQLLLTNLRTELLPLILLLFACKSLYKQQPMQLEVDVDLSTNSKLAYYAQGSMFHINQSMSTYYLNPSPKSFSKVIHDTGNETLVELLQEFIHGFVTTENFFGTTMPFLQVNVDEQNLLFDKIRVMFP